MHSFQLTISVAPLGEIECRRVIFAVRRNGLAIEQITQQKTHSAFMLTLQCETHWVDLEHAPRNGRKLATSIWRHVGRYVKIAVDVVGIDADCGAQLDYNEESYRLLVLSR